MNPAESAARRPYTMMCAECGEYMEYADEGINGAGQLCDLYICLECGYQTSVVRANLGRLPPSFSWDPPDGAYEP